MSDDQVQITDADLTAYLDGQADAALTTRIERVQVTDADLAARLAALAAPMGAIKASYDLDRLDPPKFPAEILEIRRNSRSRIVLPLAIAASFAIGMIVMSTLRPTPTWVDTVASYHALYVTDTLSGPVQTPHASEVVLDAAQDMLGVDLRPATTVADLTFKRAQILAIEGQPLLQMAYLDADGTPFAFCVTLSGADTRDLQQRTSHGLATSSWIEGGVGYLLVGGQNSETVKDFSEQLRRQL